MKILIVKTSALGDIIQCFSAIRFLHQLFPKADIDWIVEKPFGELLNAHPLIHLVYEIESKRWKQAPFHSKSWKGVSQIFKKLRQTSYDLIFDLQGNTKSGFLTFMARGKRKIGFSLSCASEWPNVLFTTKRFDVDLSAPITSQYLSLVAAPFSKHIPKQSGQVNLIISKEEKQWISGHLVRASGPKIMICLGSNWENKKLSLPLWEAFLKEVERELNPIFYFVWGNEKEEREGKRLKHSFRDTFHILPRLSLPLWQQMMGQMDLVLSVDSAALDLAATTNVRTYSFFGPSSQKIYRPLGNMHGAFQGSCPYQVSFIKRCPKLRTCKSGACLKRLSAEVLFKHFIKWYADYN